jgi:hypothetical protein
MNKYWDDEHTCYPWDDEVMREVRQRKAAIIDKYGKTPEMLHQHFVEVEAEMQKKGFKIIDSDEFRKRNFRRQMTEQL